jgi:hypothetical protein
VLRQLNLASARIFLPWRFELHDSKNERMHPKHKRRQAGARAKQGLEPSCFRTCSLNLGQRMGGTLYYPLTAAPDSGALQIGTAWCLLSAGATIYARVSSMVLARRSPRNRPEPRLQPDHPHVGALDGKTRGAPIRSMRNKATFLPLGFVITPQMAIEINAVLDEIVRRNCPAFGRVRLIDLRAW